jgi:hypothetical protein
VKNFNMNTTHTTALSGALSGSAIQIAWAKPARAAQWNTQFAEIQPAAKIKIKDGVIIPGAENP